MGQIRPPGTETPNCGVLTLIKGTDASSCSDIKQRGSGGARLAEKVILLNPWALWLLLPVCPGIKKSVATLSFGSNGIVGPASRPPTPPCSSPQSGPHRGSALRQWPVRSCMHGSLQKRSTCATKRNHWENSSRNKMPRFFIFDVGCMFAYFWGHCPCHARPHVKGCAGSCSPQTSLPGLVGRERSRKKRTAMSADHLARRVKPTSTSALCCSKERLGARTNNWNTRISKVFLT